MGDIVKGIFCPRFLTHKYTRTWAAVSMTTGDWPLQSVSN